MEAAMLCLRCEALGERQAAVRTNRTEARNRWGGAGAERLSRVLCRQCGAVLPALDPGERLLDKLSQLARFGLVAEVTLLTPSRRDG
jgi:hypothetical protein